MEKLAIHGGTPSLKSPVDTNILHQMRFGQQEKDALARIVDSGVMCRTFGSEAESYERETAGYFGTAHAVATSSGTASIHTALAAVGVGWRDEVITSPITDMGSLIGIIAQGALPVFADIDPVTFNMDPAAVEKAITSRTKAILAVHLAGSCAGIEETCRIAAHRGITVVEDVAQSWLAESSGQFAGTFGAVGCFSTNGYKHISTGDGGVAVTEDPELARRMKLFMDKAYDRAGSSRNPEVFAMNYRITELQAAVGRVQMGKLADIVVRRREIADRMLSCLDSTPGLVLPVNPEGCDHSWWYLILRTDSEATSVDAPQLADALAAEGVPAWTGYCGGRPVYQYDCFQHPERSFFPLPPLAGAGSIRELYPAGLCPVAEQQLDEMIILSVSEHYSDQQVDDMIRAVDKVCRWYADNQSA
jgi:perosamine synthetase